MFSATSAAYSRRSSATAATSCCRAAAALAACWLRWASCRIVIEKGQKHTALATCARQIHTHALMEGMHSRVCTHTCYVGVCRCDTSSCQIKGVIVCVCHVVHLSCICLEKGDERFQLKLALTLAATNPPAWLPPWSKPLMPSCQLPKTLLLLVCLRHLPPQPYLGGRHRAQYQHT